MYVPMYLYFSLSDILKWTTLKLYQFFQNLFTSMNNPWAKLSNESGIFHFGGQKYVFTLLQ